MINTYSTILKKHCLPKRYEHCIRVSREALKLAKIYGADTCAVEKAGLLHDIAKSHTPESLTSLGLDCSRYDDVWYEYPSVWHAFVGSLLIEFECPGHSVNIEPLVMYHTTGAPNMTIEEAIIFVADYIEPGRKDDRSTAARLAYESLDKAVAHITNKTIEKLKTENSLIHPFTLECWQWYSRFSEIKNEH